MVKISVCMASYNGENFIYEQLESILKQLQAEDEIIIRDDVSNDQTVAIIQSFNDCRIKLHINNRNIGYSRNFALAIEEAKGDVIFIADQDDVWDDNKVEVMLEALNDADMVVSNAEIVNEKLEMIHPSHFSLNNTQRGFWRNLLRTRYIGACMAFRAKILEKVLPFPKDVKLCAYDYWIAVVSECFYKVELVKTPLLKYRRHGKNASSGGVSSHNSFFRKIKIRIYALFKLLERRN